VLGATGLGIAGLTGCSAAASSSTAAQAPATATATAAEATAAPPTAKATGTAKATPTGTAAKAPVDRYVPALLAVLGKFEMAGGPVQPGKTTTPVRPLSGVVTFRDSGGDALSVTVGASGTFSVNLTPGSYTVTGRSKSIEQQNADGTVSDPPCSSPVKLTVRAGTTPAHVTVVCAVP
jgi:hypothetical protein